MSILNPFPAMRPRPDLASKICELPYDVMSSEEAWEIAKDNPLSFLHVSKPEIDLDPAIPIYDDRVYLKGKENFRKLIEDQFLVQDRKPSFYLYRQIMGTHTQVGIVATASCEEYEQNLIKRHEYTRPDKEDDRVRHIETLNSQTGPVFLTYKARPPIAEFVETKIQMSPAVDFTSGDRVRHTSWVLDQDEDIDFIKSEFSKIPCLYIADGHHRSAAAVRVYRHRCQNETSPFPHASAFFLSVIFPHDQMQILPYNRLVKDLQGHSPESFLKCLREIGSLKSGSHSKPSTKHEIAIYCDRKWYSLRWKQSLIESEDPTGQLDVSLLQKHILLPLLGIDDPRTSRRIQFMGGIRGTESLEKSVLSGEFQIAFSLFPTRIEDLMAIADGGGIMPPKSTWFEPKLRDAMFCHMLE